jgi:hypothetical protein
MNDDTEKKAEGEPIHLESNAPIHWVRKPPPTQQAPHYPPKPEVPLDEQMEKEAQDKETVSGTPEITPKI